MAVASLMIPAAFAQEESNELDLANEIEVEVDGEVYLFDLYFNLNFDKVKIEFNKEISKFLLVTTDEGEIITEIKDLTGLSPSEIRSIRYFEIVEESSYPPKIYDGINKGQISHVIKIDKEIAIDEFGNLWSFHHSVWNKDYIKPPVLRSDITNAAKLQALAHLGVPEGAAAFGYDRDQPEFAIFKNGQILYAEYTMDELCSECSDEPYDKINNIKEMPYRIPLQRSEDTVLQQAISQENIRATKQLADMFEYMYGYSHGKVLLP